MKNLIYLFAMTVLIGLGSCKSKIFKQEMLGNTGDISKIIDSKETMPLAQIYFEHGNFVNTKNFPPIIKNKEVYENRSEYLIIDLRNQDNYINGHINGAYNVDKKDVIDFLKNKRKASSVKKVVFVCHTGQIASFVTGVTRYAGFDNTYVMLFGMSGWNAEFSTPLKKAFGDISDKNLLKIAKGEHKSDGGEHHAAVGHHKEKAIDWSKFPQLEKGKFTALTEKRAKQLLSLKRPEFLISKGELVSALKKDIHAYYPIAYMNEKQYGFAHIDGAHQFTSRKDLAPNHKLAELPKDKPSLIYCKTGHTAGNATAYLRMLGYDTKSIILGSSSIMQKLWAEKGWQVKDVSALIGDFPVVRGKNRTNKNPFLAKATKKKSSGAPKPMVKRKKKEVSGGCG